jgi:hypothetical protein
MLTRTMAEKLAGNMLAHNGIAAIWDLHLAAVAAKDAGKTTKRRRRRRMRGIAHSLPS